MAKRPLHGQGAVLRGPFRLLDWLLCGRPLPGQRPESL